MGGIYGLIAYMALGIVVGLVLGVIEGIKPDTIQPRWQRFVAWWKALGGM